MNNSQISRMANSVIFEIKSFKQFVIYVQNKIFNSVCIFFYECQ